MDISVSGALGRLCDSNLLTAGALSGGVWSGALPLANLADTSLVARPARCATPANLADSQFDVTLTRDQAINVVALLAHNMDASAQMRISFAPLSGSLAAPTYRTDWISVWQRWQSSMAMAWEDANWWTGQGSAADMALFPKHAVWVPPLGTNVPLSGRVRVELNAPTAVFIDVGAAWIGTGFSPASNFERGRTLGLDNRDLVDEGPSGRLFAQGRTPRRTLALQWQGLSDGDARRLYDAGARPRGPAWLLFIPDAGDGAALARECWPAAWADPPTAVFNFNGTNDVRATLKEVIS